MNLTSHLLSSDAHVLVLSSSLIDCSSTEVSLLKSCSSSRPPQASDEAKIHPKETPRHTGNLSSGVASEGEKSSVTCVTSRGWSSLHSLSFQNILMKCQKSPVSALIWTSFKVSSTEHNDAGRQSEHRFPPLHHITAVNIPVPQASYNYSPQCARIVFEQGLVAHVV